MSTEPSGPSEWTLLTTHARVLVEIARDPETRMRDLAASCEVTERSIQVIIADLERAGYLSRARVGRRNRYTLHADRVFRHRTHAGYEIGPLLEMFTNPPNPAQDRAAPEEP
jgi:hypothetical protein